MVNLSWIARCRSVHEIGVVVLEAGQILEPAQVLDESRPLHSHEAEKDLGLRDRESDPEYLTVALTSELSG